MWNGDFFPSVINAYLTFMKFSIVADDGMMVSDVKTIQPHWFEDKISILLHFRPFNCSRRMNKTNHVLRRHWNRFNRGENLNECANRSTYYNVRTRVDRLLYLIAIMTGSEQSNLYILLTHIVCVCPISIVFFLSIHFLIINE